MRIQRFSGSYQKEAQDFADFLIRIVEGTEPEYRYNSH